jgi:hypothetical protein
VAGKQQRSLPNSRISSNRESEPFEESGETFRSDSEQEHPGKDAMAAPRPPAATKEARNPNKKSKTKEDKDMATKPAHATARDTVSNELMTD